MEFNPNQMAGIGVGHNYRWPRGAPRCPSGKIMMAEDVELVIGRRRIQFTLRHLLLLTTSWAMFLGLGVAFPAVALVIAGMLPFLLLGAWYIARKKPFVAIGWLCSGVIVYALSVGPVFCYYASRDWEIPDAVWEAYRPVCCTVPGSVIAKYLNLFGISDIETFFLISAYYPERNRVREEPQANNEQPQDRPTADHLR
jgi:hypothetical protein